MEITEEQMNEALDRVNYYKKATKGNKYFSKKFTDITVNKDGYCEIKRDWYEVNKARAIEISKKHGIFDETKYHGITDDDTIADWLFGYEGDLGGLQRDYPEMTIYEIQDIFTWNTLCQQRAGSFCANEFTNTQTYIIN